MAAKVTRKNAPTAPQTPSKASFLPVADIEGESRDRTLTRVMLQPDVRHAQLCMGFASAAFGDKETPNIIDATHILAETLAKAQTGDKGGTSRLLAAQAATLDSIFAEMARRSAMNLGKYPDAADRYMRLALKAQTACRTTLESLAKLHQPREQTIRHVHVAEGGQAVIADQFHHHTGKHGGEGTDAK